MMLCPVCVSFSIFVPLFSRGSFGTIIDKEMGPKYVGLHPLFTSFYWAWIID